MKFLFYCTSVGTAVSALFLFVVGAGLLCGYDTYMSPKIYSAACILCAICGIVSTTTWWRVE